ADEGDWSVRQLGPLDIGYRGWEWLNAHDGGGKSLELINPALPNEYGQNWSASDVNNGTPGRTNSVNDGDIAPLILEVEHFSFIPGPNDAVTVMAKIMDELPTGIAVKLHYRVDRSVYSQYVYPHYNPNDYNNVVMFDDGLHGDGSAGDGLYGGQIPAYPDKTIIEFFIEASNANSNTRTWPAPSTIDGVPEQVTNLLYQVDKTFDPNVPWVPGSQPMYRIIMTKAENDRLKDIVPHSSLEGPNCQMNSTFISADGVDMKMRYNVGVRNRGHGSRNDMPNNYHVNFVHDRPWKDVTAINLNTKFTYLQLVGNALFRKAGIAQCDTTAVQVRVNGENMADMAPTETYGSYVHLEVVDSDFAENHYPGDDAGNTYQCMRVTHQADLRYEGQDPAPYRNNYFKETNTAEDDWSDLIELTYVLSNNTPDNIYVQEVNRVLNAEQWLRLIAVNVLLNNRETSLCNGNADDYHLYRGVEDTRFVLIQHDLDSIFGMGQTIGSYTDGFLEATNIPTMKRFMERPEFMPRYYWHLKNLIETTLSAEQLNPFLDEFLGGWVPTGTINQMKTFMAQRNAYVLSLIPSALTIQSDLTQVSGYYQTNSSTTALHGTADAVNTRSLRVNDRVATWSPRNATWSISGVTLNPGINRIIVRTYDDPNGTGNELEHGYIDIWYNDGGDLDISGTLATNTTLDAASGPWHVTDNITVLAGVTLTIQPGTTLFFEPGKGITINGRLLAEGTEFQRIRFTKTPGSGNWAGFQFLNPVQQSRIAYADMEYCDSGSCAIKADHAA
ncbi:MAG: CotH kinase family protein, partial [Dehalococcoidia bacterium]|nr:CotH kinase family protein [Dehalococcoidia bacterium]